MKRPNTISRYCLVLIILAAALCSAANISAQNYKPPSKRVLAIFVFKQSMPWPYQLERSLRAALTTNPSYPIELDVEFADQLTFSKEDYLAKVIDLYSYKYKYSKQKVDLVLVLGDESANLMLEYGRVLFGDIPVALITIEQKKLPPALLKLNIVSLMWGFDLTKMGPLIHDLLPKTRNLYVISGSSLTDRKFKKLTAEALDEFDGPFTTHYLDDLVVEDIFLKVSQLPENSAIIFLTIFRDASGRSFVPRDIMTQVSEKANAPTFGVIDAYLGRGIVGGHLLSAEIQGRRYAEIAKKMLSGTPLTESIYKENANKMMFDWRQLKRWSIDVDRLPTGSIIRYRQPSVWVDHKWTIVFIIVIIATQSIALLGLIIQRRRSNLAKAETQRLQDERAHTSRVLAMGEIAASLAHELNQPLSAIRSYAQAAQRFLTNSPAEPNEAGKALAGVVAGNRRAEEVIKRIRMALKKEPFKRAHLEVKDLIQDVIVLVRGKADEKNTSLNIKLTSDLPPLFGDRIQLQQVLLNLIINGIEAMTDGDGDHREVFVQAIREKPDVVTISVRDSGIGIADNQETILFDAFYTTKPEGMGMGLSISRSIIEDHGGRLWATKNPEKGTTFFFTVPIIEENKK